MQLVPFGAVALLGLGMKFLCTVMMQNTRKFIHAAQTSLEASKHAIIFQGYLPTSMVTIARFDHSMMR